MHNNIKTAIKDFKAVKFMITARDRISSVIIGMHFEQIMEYFEESKVKLADK